MRILVTGSSGLLGGEIKKLDPELICPDTVELDITKPEQIQATIEKYQPDTILHLAAATNPPAHEKDPTLGLEVNIIGSAYVALACFKAGIRLVYTSSDYLYFGPGPHKETEPVFAPNNFYLSKLGGECAVRLCPKHLVLRLSFGPRPFPYDKVYDKQKNSKLYVEEMASLVLAAAKSDAQGILNLGGKAQTLEEYAKQTRPDIGLIPTPDWVPEDTSLDLSKMRQALTPNT